MLSKSFSLGGATHGTIPQETVTAGRTTVGIGPAPCTGPPEDVLVGDNNIVVHKVTRTPTPEGVVLRVHMVILQVLHGLIVAVTILGLFLI